MNIKDAYEIMEADYADVIERLMNDRLVYKYNKKFETNEDYRELVQALEKKDYEVAFRMAHNLKGMSLNLGYKGLFEVSSSLCEELRDGNPKADLNEMLGAVTEKYEKVLSGIALMDEV